MRQNRPLLFCLLMASICSASFIHGDIYSQDLQRLDKTVITIDGAFSYQLVTDKGNYSIFLPEGRYKISASSPDAGLHTEQEVVIGADDQTLDLVLKPKDDFGALPYLAVAALLVVVFLWANSHWKTKSAFQEPEPEARTVSRPVELDEDAKSVLHVLDGMEGRATQKELKETLKFSDTKLSLILTELEQTGHVKKFKRGRANVVRKL